MNIKKYWHEGLVLLTFEYRFVQGREPMPGARGGAPGRPATFSTLTPTPAAQHITIRHSAVPKAQSTILPRNAPSPIPPIGATTAALPSSPPPDYAHPSSRNTSHYAMSPPNLSPTAVTPSPACPPPDLILSPPIVQAWCNTPNPITPASPVIMNRVSPPHLP